MATKTELENEVERLKGVIREQQRALEKLSHDNGVEMAFPTALHNVSCGPLLMDGSESKCQTAVIKVIYDAVREHAIPYEVPGAFANESLEQLADWGGVNKRFVVPTLAAKIIVGLVDAIANYGAAMYRTGYDEASTHLAELAKGKTSPKDYEEQVKRCKKTAPQEHKRFRIRAR